MDNIKQQLIQLARTGRLAEAQVASLELVNAAPQDIEAWWIRAQILLESGQFEEGIRALYQVCQGPSNFYLPAVELASKVAFEKELWELLIPPTEQLQKIAKYSKLASYRLGLAYFRLGRYVAAIQYLALLEPGDEFFLDASYFYGLASCLIGESHASVERMLIAMRSSDISWEMARDFLLLANYDEKLSGDDVFELHQEFSAAKFCPPELLVEQLGLADYGPEQCLNIAFVSADFRAHSVASFLLPVLRNLKEVNWSLTLYSDVEKEDSVTELMKSFDIQWVDIRGWDLATRVKKIREQKHHLVVDLMGYSSASVLREFACRLAPVQVTWLGYPNTTGLEVMDYRISDPISDPETPSVDSVHTERLIRMSGGFLCFEPSVEGSALATYREKKHSVYGCFNNLNKYSEKMIESWAKVLLADPGSILLLKTKVLKDEEVCKRLASRFEKYGVTADRLQMLSWTAGQKEHLELYDDVDVHLDTYPYNGTTTTYESLWQGVPTVTLCGDDHRSRVSTSILTRLGKQSWVARNQDEYVKIATTLAKDKVQLRSFKSEARKLMADQGMLDGKAFIGELDEVFRQMLHGK